MPARAAGEDPREQLVALVAEVAATVRRPGFRGCAFRNYLAEFPEDDPRDGDDAPAAVAHAQLARARAEVVERVARLGVPDPDRLVEQLWLLVDGLYLHAAYRDRLDDHLDDHIYPAADAAVDLARRLVGA